MKSQNIKILYISFADVSQTSGPSVNERQFIPTLYSEIGENAHFLIPKPQEELPKDLPLSAISFFPSSKKRKPLPWIKQQLSLIKNIQRILKEKEIDLIVIRKDIFDFALRYATKKAKIPYALKTAGSGEYKVFNRKNKFIQSLAGLNETNLRKLIKDAILVDVVSLAQRDSLRKICGENDKIIWIDNGVDLNQFKPLNKREVKKELNLAHLSPIIGYAGNFPWKRGAMQILKVLPKLKEQFPTIGMVSLGSGQGMELLYQEARRLKIEDRCIFTGQVPFEKVPKYINAMDICVSQRDAETQAASELKVRQYLACGKPVIVSPGGANDFVEEENLGYIVEPYDEDGFYNAVKNILTMKESAYRDLNHKAQAYAEKNLSYTSKVAERLSLYIEIIEKK